MANPTFYQQPKDKIAATTTRAEELPKLLENAFQRWEELEA